MRFYGYLIGCSFALLGCSADPSTHSPWPADSEVVDAGNGSTFDSGEVELDSGNTSSTDQDMGLAMISPPNPERWLAERPCAEPGRTVETVSDGPFEVPTTPEFTTQRTRGYYEQTLGRPLPTGIQIQADSKYGVENGIQYDIFVNPGDDLVFRMHFLQPKFDDRYIVTPMLDYEPVEVTFQRYSSDREQLLEEITDTGYLFETVDRLDPVDMTIPASAFTPGRMHEVAVAMRGVVSTGESVGATYRFPVFYGGFEPPSEPLPCVPAPLGEERDTFDARIQFSHKGWDVASIFTVPTLEIDAHKQIREVRPGETVRFFASVFRDSREYGPIPVMFQPTLNGRPVEEPWWRSRNGPAALEAVFYVDSRDHFDITFPEEPGVYYVALKAFESPWERWREFGDPDAVSKVDVMNKELVEGSNVLRFRVIGTDDSK